MSHHCLLLPAKYLFTQSGKETLKVTFPICTVIIPENFMELRCKMFEWIVKQIHSNICNVTVTNHQYYWAFGKREYCMQSVFFQLYTHYQLEVTGGILFWIWNWWIRWGRLQFMPSWILTVFVALGLKNPFILWTAKKKIFWFIVSLYLMINLPACIKFIKLDWEDLILVYFWYMQGGLLFYWVPKKQDEAVDTDLLSKLSRLTSILQHGG